MLTGKMNSVIILMAILQEFTKCVLSRKVSLTAYTTGFEGTNSTNLTCVIDKENGDFLSTVIFSTRNSSNEFENILYQHVNFGTILYKFWFYLFENVTQELAPITSSSTAVVINIDNLLCKHDREYRCEAAFDRIGHSAIAVPSNTINITVKVKPSKPESIQLLGKLVDNSMPSTTEYSPSRSTMEHEESVKHETFTTTNVPPPANDLYDSGPVTENDMIIFSCSANVGKPPSSFKWEKFQSSGTITTYNDTNTDIIYHSENCSFHRTSNITLQMSAADNNAIVSCVVVSDISNEKLFAETDPIIVLYKVRLPNITKQPNKDIYGKETKNIALTCNSDGNPKPSYVWSRNGNILHNDSVMVISNVTVDNSGTYMCNVSNYVDNVMYSTSVSIVIVEEIVTTSTRTTTLPIPHGTIEVIDQDIEQDNNTNTNVYIIVGVVIAVVVIAVVAVGILCKYKQHRGKHRRKTNEGLHDYVNNAANLSSSNYDDLGVMRNESHYDELKHNNHVYTNISPQ